MNKTGGAKYWKNVTQMQNWTKVATNRNLSNQLILNTSRNVHLRENLTPKTCKKQKNSKMDNQMPIMK